MPWESVIASLKLAQNNSNFNAYDNVRSKYQKDLDKDVGTWTDSPELRLAIGQAAKACDWFKDITRGDLWFQTISPTFSDPVFSKKDLTVKLNKLWTWVERV